MKRAPSAVAQTALSAVSQEELKARRKGDEFKVRLAGQLRAQTTVTVAWIAERLHMGTRGHLTHLLYHRNKAAN